MSFERFMSVQGYFYYSKNQHKVIIFYIVAVRETDDERGVPQLPHLREGPAAAVQEPEEALQEPQHLVGEILRALRTKWNGFGGKQCHFVFCVQLFYFTILHKNKNFA